MNGSITGLATSEQEAAALKKYGEFFRATVHARGAEWAMTREEKVFPRGENPRWVEGQTSLHSTREAAEAAAVMWRIQMALREAAR